MRRSHALQRGHRLPPERRTPVSRPADDELLLAAVSIATLSRTSELHLLTVPR